MNPQDYFETLSLSPGDMSGEDLEAAYLKKKKEALYESLSFYGLTSDQLSKPDLGMIDEAYIVLKNPTKRDDAQFQSQVNKKRKITNEIKKHLYPEYLVDLDFESLIAEQKDFDGAFLTKVREYKKINLSKMEELSKVAIRHLRNIEEDNYKDLPASVYLRGFLINYAKVLDLNENFLISSYLKKFYEHRGH